VIASEGVRTAQLGGRSVRGVLYSEEAIRDRIREIARDLSQAYAPEDRLLVVGLLKGSFIFLADLVREIELPLQVDFLVAASYAGTASTGKVRFLYAPETPLEGRAVLLVEDIIDSGTTLARIVPLLEARGPKSLEICALLHKRLTVLPKEARWVGFDAPNEFLVGYGLDCDEQFRHLPYIACL
jgi:hypoxanthine phosphoribosyltransferase